MGWGAIGIPSADPDDLDDQSIVEYFVDNPEVADPHPEGVGLADQRHTSGWAGLLGQQVESGPDPLLVST